MEPDENQQENEVAPSLASHFGTNYTPTEDECLEIHNLLIEPSARIAELEVEMARKAADTWRAIALATPALWASLHIPVPQPLTDELLFRSDLEREDYWTSMEDVLRKRTRAMQEWLARSGACGLSISLHDRDSSSYTLLNTNYEGFLNAIISRSKRWHSMEFITSADYLRRVATLTAEDVPALEELIINMTSYFPHPADGDSFSSTVNWAESSFLSAPRLCRVSFHNLDENINMLPIRWQQLTHISLTGMSVGGQNHVRLNIATLLARCPGLISAKLEIAYHGPVPIPPPFVGPLSAAAEPFQSIYRNPILLPNIIDLSLQNNGTDISSLFAILDMPRLTTLKYHTTAIAEPIGELIALVGRVSETLVNFTTNAVMFSRKDFFSILKAAHRLKSLSNRRGSPIEPPDPWEHHTQGVLHFDDTFLGMLVGKRLGLLNLNTKGNAKPEEGKLQGIEEVADDYSCVLLPELESFDSPIPVSFTDDGLLECLKLRQNPVHGNDESTASSSIYGVEAKVEIAHSTPYAKFKHFSAGFSRGETRPMSEEISSFIKEGLALHLSYSPRTVVDRFSPAEGIIDERASTFYPW